MITVQLLLYKSERITHTYTHTGAEAIYRDLHLISGIERCEELI